MLVVVAVIYVCLPTTRTLQFVLLKQFVLVLILVCLSTPSLQFVPFHKLTLVAMKLFLYMIFKLYP